MNKENSYKHWRLETDAENILWLVFDRQGASVNTINQEVLDELNQIIDGIERNPPAGVVIESGKKQGFVAGADVQQFTKFKSADDAMAFIRQGQETFNRLAAVKVPTVAMIDGFCLGGGLELALACRYRVAENGRKTKLGLPEVKLGLQPGWGGSVRLPRLIGVQNAMNLMLTGRAISARAANKLGFVDAAVPLRQLRRAARSYVINKLSQKRTSQLQSLLSNKLIRPLIGKMLQKKLAQKVRKDHYPAPYAMVDMWLKNGTQGKHAFKDEADSICKLALTNTSRNLVRVFFLQEKVKGLAKNVEFAPQHVHVVGAGTMGGDIAAWCALRGLHVTLQDQTPEQIAPAIKRAYQLFKKKLKLPREIQAAMDRLIPDLKGIGVAKADVIIEAIFENLEVKQKVFKQLEAKAKPDAILATNTSSIPLDEINIALKNPARLVGIHFFNPVALMQLVEIVTGAKTDAAVASKAIAFVRKIDRLPLPVKSSPGFLVNRALMPYLMECMVLLEEGVSGPGIDKVAEKFGMPMGPVELADTVGLDVCLSVAENLSSHYGGKVSDHLRKMVEKGELGRKTGKGFYNYNSKGKPTKEQASKGTVVPFDVTDRLILRMVNEAVACLREGVVSDADLLDTGMIFGTGFAPFRGGPMQYVKTQGSDKIYATLQQLEKKHGERFKPDAGWSQLLKQQPSEAGHAAKPQATTQQPKPESGEQADTTSS